MSASADRPLWFPGGTSAPHLDGSLPGDFGFDPLRFGAEPESLKWMQQAELQHCRWAMLGSAGVLVPEVLNAAGVADLPNWAEAGKAEYFTDPVTLGLVMMILFNWAEVRRWRDIVTPGSVSEDPIFKGQGFKCTGTEVGYPGGKWFDPFDFASSDQFKTNKQKEVLNGRLAMISMLGYWSQAFVTGTGPVANLTTHVADPSHNTIFQSFGY